MFAERYPDAAGGGAGGLARRTRRRSRAWVGAGPWAASEVAVLAAPAGPAGEPLREMARRGIPVAGLPTADTRDELGSTASTRRCRWPPCRTWARPGRHAYQTLPEANQCSLHARLDVTRWTDIDEE